MSVDAGSAAASVLLRSGDGLDRGCSVSKPQASTRHVYRASDLVELLHQRANKPWIGLRLSGEQVVRVPTGTCVSLTAATGFGKSSLALQFVWTHADQVGPAVYVSLELDADELAARIVGQRSGASWEDALRGRVPAAQCREALDLPRLRVLDRDAATLEQLEACVSKLQDEYPGEPVLVVIDYLQIVGDLESEARTRVASVVEQIRRLAKRLDVVAIMISQCSREVSDQLNNGNRVGDRTTAAGAETAQIERAAQTTLALGDKHDPDGDWAKVSLSIGKNRMGPGNVVVPIEFNGRTGEFRTAGAPQPATEVTRDRASEYDRRVVDAVRSAGHGFKNPTAIYKACGGQKEQILAAIRRQLGKDGGLEYRVTGKTREIHARG